MSNKTQLQTNNTQLSSLIQELANKAVGGGSGAVETCTVTIENAGNYTSVLYVTYDNGLFVPHLVDISYGTDNHSYFQFITPIGQVIYILSGDSQLSLDAENAELIIHEYESSTFVLGIRVMGDTTITE